MPAVKRALDHSFQLPLTFHEAQRLFQAYWIKIWLIRTLFQFADITEWPASRGLSGHPGRLLILSGRPLELRAGQLCCRRHSPPPGLDLTLSGLSQRTGKAERPSRVFPGGALFASCAGGQLFRSLHPLCQRHQPAPGPRVQ